MKAAPSLAALIPLLIGACSPPADPPAIEQDIALEPGSG